MESSYLDSASRIVTIMSTCLLSHNRFGFRLSRIARGPVSGRGRAISVGQSLRSVPSPRVELGYSAFQTDAMTALARSTWLRGRELHAPALAYEAELVLDFPAEESGWRPGDQTLPLGVVHSLSRVIRRARTSVLPPVERPEGVKPSSARWQRAAQLAVLRPRCCLGRAPWWSVISRLGPLRARRLSSFRPWTHQAQKCRASSRLHRGTVTTHAPNNRIGGRPENRTRHARFAEPRSAPAGPPETIWRGQSTLPLGQVANPAPSNVQPPGLSSWGRYPFRVSFKCPQQPRSAWHPGTA